MPYEIEFTRAADKAFSALPNKIKDRIDAALDGLEQDPWPAGHKKLKGSKETFFRIRVGDYLSRCLSGRRRAVGGGPGSDRPPQRGLPQPLNAALTSPEGPLF